jgi:hypothetical protein
VEEQPQKSSPGGATKLSPAPQRWEKWERPVKSRRDGPVLKQPLDWRAIFRRPSGTGRSPIMKSIQIHRKISIQTNLKVRRCPQRPIINHLQLLSISYSRWRGGAVIFKPRMTIRLPRGVPGTRTRKPQDRRSGLGTRGVTCDPKHSSNRCRCDLLLLQAILNGETKGSAH